MQKLKHHKNHEQAYRPMLYLRHLRRSKLADNLLQELIRGTFSIISISVVYTI